MDVAVTAVAPPAPPAPALPAPPTVTLAEATANDPPEVAAARHAFLTRLGAFLAERDKALKKVPIMRNREMDLFRLYWYVGQREGYTEVTKTLKWLEVCKLLLDPLLPSTGSSTKLRETYERFLLEFEREIGYPVEVFGTLEPSLVDRKPTPASAMEAFLTPTQLRQRQQQQLLQPFGAHAGWVQSEEAVAPPAAVPASVPVPAKKRARKSEDGTGTATASGATGSSAGTNGTVRQGKKRSAFACELCHRSSSSDNDALVDCGGCQRTFHQLCHTPPVQWQYAYVGHLEWFCADCVLRRKRETCGACAMTHASSYNYLVVCQRCCKRWHRLCLDLTPEELVSPWSLVNSPSWVCRDCAVLNEKRTAELLQMSKSELCAHLQRLNERHASVNLAAVIEASRVSVQRCSELELIMWALNDAGRRGSGGVTLSELLAAVSTEFGLDPSDRDHAVQQSVNELIAANIVERHAHSGKYAIRSNVTIDVSATGAAATAPLPSADLSQ